MKLLAQTQSALGYRFYGGARNGRNAGGLLLSTGVYFYRLRAGGQTPTRKLLLLQ